MQLSERDRRVLAEFESVLRDSDPSLVLQFPALDSRLGAGGGTIPRPADAPRHPQLVALAAPPQLSSPVTRPQEIHDEHESDAPTGSGVTHGC